MFRFINRSLSGFNTLNPDEDQQSTVPEVQKIYVQYLQLCTNLKNKIG